jgi:hypothetical protein
VPSAYHKGDEKIRGFPARLAAFKTKELDDYFAMLEEAKARPSRSAALPGHLFSMTLARPAMFLRAAQ